MRSSGDYSEVLLEPDVSEFANSHLRPDILARESSSGKRVLIECKSATSVTDRWLIDAVNQLTQYQELLHADQAILSLPARLTAHQREQLQREGIVAWDLDELARRFRLFLDDVEHPLLRALLLAVAGLSSPGSTPSPEGRLLDDLRSLPPGRDSWVAYQKLITKICERLFCPPLSPPIVERSDDLGVNRRDIILPNYAESGFWAFVRARYWADFVVVDAKNHKDPIDKLEALKVLNYLKPYGAGMLGVVICRAGADDSCLATIREHWAHQNKLLVVLADEHVERMLRLKEAGGLPEDVIRRWIEEFRLSN
jgi:hypothetical protein